METAPYTSTPSGSSGSNHVSVARYIRSTPLASQSITMSESPPNEEDFKYSVETFANIMLTEIIPVYFVIDKKIIKIMTLKFLDNVNEGEPVNASDAELLAERNDSGSSSTE